MSTQPSLHEPRTVLTDIDIPFGRLVVFFIKAGLAAIPATIIIWLIVMLLMVPFGMLFGWSWMHRPI
jgi:hypothetical protein